MAKFISKLQLYLTHSEELIVVSQRSIYLININMVDMPEYHTAILVAMGDITKKLILHGVVLENLDVDTLMKESREAHLMTASIKTSVDNDMTQPISAAAKVGSMSAFMTQIFTPGSVGRLYATHQALNMG